MRIENEKIQLANLNFEQIRMDRRLYSSQVGNSLSLSPQQLEILDLLGHGASVREVVEHFYRRGVCVSFSALEQLLLFLVEEDLISNPLLRTELRRTKPKRLSFLARAWNRIGAPSAEPIDLERELAGMPFFRSIKPKMFSAFLNRCELLPVSAGARICRTGQKSRNLFVLLRGRACVSRGRSGERLTTLHPGAIFGEVGFFLGEPRTADVVADSRSLIARIPHSADIQVLLKREHAQELQQRLWMVHALLGSALFQNIPHDCFDALIFAGDYKTFPANSWICREGDAGSTCYIIVRGQAEVSRQGQTIGSLKQGECFGEVALILTGGRRTASVRAEGELLVLEISSQRFYDLLSQNLLLACEFEKTAFSRIQADQRRD